MGDGPEPRKWDRARIVGLAVCIIYGLMLTVWNATKTGRHDWFGSIMFTGMLVASLLIIRRYRR